MLDDSRRPQHTTQPRNVACNHLSADGGGLSGNNASSNTSTDTR